MPNGYQWLRWTKDLGPLVISIAVFFVTISFHRWQTRLAKQKLRRDLYERRFATYRSFRDLVLALVEKNDNEIQTSFREAGIARLEIPFLFGDASLRSYLDGLYNEILEVIKDINYLQSVKEHGAMMSDPRIVKEVAERGSRLGGAKLDICGRHLEELVKQFGRFLKLSDFAK